MVSSKQLPSRAQVVIVGGGVIGCSTAYHLAKRGWTDAVLLEQNTLTSGTTWHAAGLITQARPTRGMREMVVRSLEVFKNLESDTGFSTGYQETGTIHLATSVDRMEELRHVASAARGTGIDVQMLSPDEVIEAHPLVNPQGVVGGVLFPGEGRGSATDTTMSLARGATQRGAQVIENVQVLDVLVDRGRVVGVSTDQGDIECEVVVNATGMWGRQFGASHGVEVPLQALAHYYIVTEAIPDLPRNLPTIKSGDEHAYVKDEAGALMVGFFEPDSYAWASRGIPENSGFIHLPEDWDHVGPHYERMIERLPVLEDAGIRLHFCGPESFTPDGVYHLGEAPALENYFVAAGFNSTGFLSGPGAGSVLADLIVDGTPSLDLTEADPGRTQPHEMNRRFLEERVVETLDQSYLVHFPGRQRESARGLRRSPVHQRTEQAGAVFGELLGWERPNFYAPPSVSPAEVQELSTLSFGRPGWFDRVAAEQRAVREDVGMLDISSFGKLLVQGPHALNVLQWLCTADVDVPVGRIVYTQWLNTHGGIEADVTVTRVAETEFLVLSGPATINRDHARLQRAVRAAQEEGRWATVTDVTHGSGMLAVMGPSSRALLQGLTDADLSDEAFPFGTSQVIDLGHAMVRATRITYVGELGWELLMSSDVAVHVFDTIRDAGRDHSLAMAGYYALGSLRLEKAYRSWGHEIGPCDTPLQAGLGFTVAWDKPGGFTGREALAKQREHGIDRRLVQFLLPGSDHLLVHDEPVYRDGVLVGTVASAGYGHSLGGSVALGWVTGTEPGLPRDWFASGAFEIESATTRLPVTASLRPLYDPTSARIKR